MLNLSRIELEKFFEIYLLKLMLVKVEYYSSTVYEMPFTKENGSRVTNF